MGGREGGENVSESLHEISLLSLTSATDISERRPCPPVSVRSTNFALTTGTFSMARIC